MRKSALQIIADHRIPDDPEQYKSVLEEAIGFIAAISSESATGFRRSLVAVALRAIETQILSDEHLVNLAKYWKSNFNSAEEQIHSRMKELLGVDAPRELVLHIKRRLNGLSQDWHQDSGPTPGDIEEIFSRIGDASPTRELRCENCGYHFRKIDTGSERREAAESAGLVFAEYLEPKRKADFLKPSEILSSNKKNIKPRSLTRLEIDHIIPRFGFGGTYSDNLQVLCSFCNGAKFAYRRPLEPLSPAIAGSLQLQPPRRSHSVLRQLIVASAVSEAGVCSKCSAPPPRAELTVAPLEVPSWFVPWGIRVVCYGCFGD